jgi:hypothetical protein
MTNAQKLLSAALGQLGYKEGKNNQNKFTDLAAGVPQTEWCAGFELVLCAKRRQAIFLRRQKNHSLPRNF